MKRAVLMLIVVLSFAQAQGVQWGFKLGLDTPQVVGLMLRWQSEQWGIRATVGGFFDGLAYSVEAHSFYRFATANAGSGGYVGLGTGMVLATSRMCVAVPGVTCAIQYIPIWTVSGLLGYELELGRNTRAYLELRPTYELNPVSDYRPLPFIPAFGIGVVWLF